MAVKQNAPVAVNGSGGALVALSATTFARGISIQEDGPAANRQGLTITWPDGNVNNYAPGDEPIVIGNVTGGGMGPLVGTPANYNGAAAAAPATVYCELKSLTATATSVRVTEYN